ncbi:MAG: hypothetical protein WCK48_02335 [bacterium]
MEGQKEFLLPETVEKDESLARKLQKDLFRACEKSNFNLVRILREKFEREYPDQLEGVEALFGFVDCLRDTDKLDRGEVKHKDRSKVYEELTQYQFLVSHFIKENSEDKEFLTLFWNALHKISAPGYIREFNIYKHGILTQVATFKIFEKIGENPTMSHPKEDAFKSIDMWVGEDAVQIKGDARATKLELVEVKKEGVVGVPGIIIDKNNQSRYFSSEMFGKIQRFKVKFEEYKKYLGKEHIKAYFLVIPFSMIDPVTGEPSAELVAEAKSKIDQMN